MPGYDLTDDSLSGRVAHEECCRCGFDVALCKQRGPDRRS